MFIPNNPIGYKSVSWTYSSGKVYIVIVMVALAEELLALLILLITSLWEMLVSAREISVSFKPSRTNPTRRIARVTTVTRLTLISALFRYQVLGLLQ